MTERAYGLPSRSAMTVLVMPDEIGHLAQRTKEIAGRSRQ